MDRKSLSALSGEGETVEAASDFEKDIE